MSDYKLIYFNIRGRGELIRLVLAKAGVKYEDERIEFADWPKLKEKTPWGTVPVFKTGGVEIGQSIPIARYLATKHGLTGKDALQAAVADTIVSATTDLFDKYVTVHFMKDEAAKMTWADIALLNFLHKEWDDPQLNKNHPKMVAHIKKIGADPAIKTWLEKRPKTDM